MTTGGYVIDTKPHGQGPDPEVASHQHNDTEQAIPATGLVMPITRSASHVAHAGAGEDVGQFDSDRGTDEALDRYPSIL